MAQITNAMFYVLNCFVLSVNSYDNIKNDCHFIILYVKLINTGKNLNSILITNFKKLQREHNDLYILMAYVHWQRSNF